MGNLRNLRKSFLICVKIPSSLAWRIFKDLPLGLHESVLNFRSTGREKSVKICGEVLVVFIAVGGDGFYHRKGRREQKLG
ncbi:MAG: hypothetical protein ACI8UZ_003077 [Akkermansiaceae bacterium]|jgi:hypothetical protein